MALNKQALKTRINSISSTMKITKAMELIANVKLQKQRGYMEKNREYSRVLFNTVSSIISSNNIDNEFLKEKKSDKKLTIVFSSDMGLCGGYNTNMIKLAQDTLRKDDYVVLIGKKQAYWYRNNEFNIIKDNYDSDNIKFSDIKEIMDFAIDMYKEDKISAIQVLYTEFVNTLTFDAKLETLLPCLMKKTEKDKNVMMEFEPNADEILNELIPMMLHNVVYSLWIQTKTAEQGSRRLAMENASDNALELSESLLLKYNQARQAAITQEIVEIVGGVDAL